MVSSHSCHSHGTCTPWRHSMSILERRLRAHVQAPSGCSDVINLPWVSSRSVHVCKFASKQRSVSPHRMPPAILPHPLRNIAVHKCKEASRQQSTILSVPSLSGPVNYICQSAQRRHRSRRECWETADVQNEVATISPSSHHLR